MTSHLLPKAIYRALRQDDRHPILIRGDVAIETAKQVHGPFLCYDCEQKFGAGAEAIIAPLLALPGKGFQLLTQIETTWATDGADEKMKLLGAPAGTPLVKDLTTYLLFFFWKWAAGKNVWRLPNASAICLGPYLERLRKHLHEGTPLPAGVSVFLNLLEHDGETEPHHASLPTMHRHEGIPVYEWYMPGIRAWVMLSRQSHPLAEAALTSPFRSRVAVMSVSDHDALSGLGKYIGEATARGKLARSTALPAEHQPIHR